jgi:hypothetical protein
MDQDRLLEFRHRFVLDIGASNAVGNVLVGDRLAPLNMVLEAQR